MRILILLLGIFIIFGGLSGVFGDVSPKWNYNFGDEITSLSMTNDGKYCVVGVKSGEICLFDNDGNILWKYSVNGTPYVDISPNGRYVGCAVYENGNGEVLVFDVNGSLIKRYDILEELKGKMIIYKLDVYGIKMSNGNCFIIKVCPGDGNTYVCAFNVYRGLLWYTYCPDDYTISEDGEYIVAECGGYYNKLGEEIWCAYTSYSDVVLSEHGEIFVGASDNHITVFDNTGEKLYDFKASIDNIKSIDLSKNKKYIAVGSRDHYIYVYTIDGKLLWKYKTGSVVEGVKISRNGEYIGAGSDDNCIYFFDKNGNLLFKYDTGDWVNKIDMSDDGRYIVGGNAIGQIYFFDTGYVDELQEMNTTNQQINQTVKENQTIINQTETTTNQTTEENKTETKTEIEKSSEIELSTLSISSTPSDADVYINGEYKGKTPLVIELKPGDYEIKLTKSGYYAFVTTKTLGAGDELILECNLIPIKGTDKNIGEVEISSTPDGEIFINGVSYGRTPKTIELSPGEYVIEIFREGYEPYSIKLNVESNKKYVISAKLTQRKTTNHILNKFREKPTINLYLPVDTFKTNENGVIELVIKNPSVNDVTLCGELNVRVPSNVIVEGGDGVGGAGYYSKTFTVQPGDSKEISLYIKCQNPGRYLVHAKVYYYIDKNKDNYEVITLTKPINVLSGEQNIESNVVEEKSQNENGGSPFIYIIGILVVLGAIGGLALIKLKGNKNEEEK